jgi:2-keto-3-deoxy-L-rhamnonate aldolase RhmA
MNISYRLANLIAAGRPAIGFWINLGDAALADLAGVAGYDWVMIDTEHNPFVESDVQAMVYAAAASDVSCVVRVRANREDHVKWVLDCGASGVIIPGIRDVEDARNAVQIAKYHPLGARGFGPNRASNYFTRGDEYTSGANGRVMLICQIELASAVEQVELIAQVEGIDALWIGPTDLAQSLGRMGQPKHPDVVAAADRVIECARRYGKPWGMPTSAVEDFEHYTNRGGTLMVLGSDTGLLRAIASDRVRGARDAIARRDSASAPTTADGQETGDIPRAVAAAGGRDGLTMRDKR